MRGLLLTLFSLITLVQIYSSEKEEHYSPLWVQVSFYKSWEKVDWKAHSFSINEDGKQTKNLMGYDWQFGFTSVKNWGVWGRATQLGGRRTYYPLIYDDIDLDSYYLSEDGEWGTEGESGRTHLSVGVSYAITKGKWQILPKLGFGMSLAKSSRFSTSLKKKGENLEYDLDYQQTRRGSFLDMGVDVRYKIFKRFYATIGLRYMHGLGRYKQRRTLTESFNPENYRVDVYKSKLPIELGLNGGIGLSF